MIAHPETEVVQALDVMSSEAAVETDCASPDASRRGRSRERVARHRHRRDAGEFCVSLQLPAAETEDMLIEKGFLAVERADDKEAVREALGQFIRRSILTGASM